MLPRLFALLAALAAAPALADASVVNGNLEMLCAAVPSLELTPEAAQGFNVAPAPDRAVLTITLLKKNRAGQAEAVPGQVYAGAIDQNNHLFSIPIREVKDGDSVYYLGEFRVNTPNTMRFLVNANVLGKPLKAEFSRVFSAP